MARRPPSSADQRIIDGGATQGVSISAAQLERWRQFGVLPRNVRQSLGRGRGSTSTPAASSIDLACALGARSTPGVPLEQVVLQIYFEQTELPIAVEPLRTSLQWFLDHRDNSAHGRAYAAAMTARATGGTEEDVEDAVAGAVADHYRRMSAPLLAAIRSRFPQVEDMAVAAMLGPHSIGDAAVTSIPERSADDVVGAKLRAALTTEIAENEAPAAAMISATFDREHQRLALDAATGHDFATARQALLELAAIVQAIQVCALVEPADEEGAQLMALVSADLLLGNLKDMFGPESLGRPIPWIVGSKLVIASVVSPWMGTQLAGIRDALMPRAVSYVERIRRRPDRSPDSR